MQSMSLKQLASQYFVNYLGFCLRKNSFLSCLKSFLLADHSFNKPLTNLVVADSVNHFQPKFFIDSNFILSFDFDFNGSLAFITTGVTDHSHTDVVGRNVNRRTVRESLERDTVLDVSCLISVTVPVVCLMNCEDANCVEELVLSSTLNHQAGIGIGMDSSGCHPSLWSVLGRIYLQSEAVHHSVCIFNCS